MTRWPAGRRHGRDPRLAAARHPRWRSLVGLGALLLSTHVHAAAVPRLLALGNAADHASSAAALLSEPHDLEARLWADLADGKLQHMSLAAACLVASGIESPERLDRRLAQWDGARERIGRAPHSPRSLLEAIHREMLRRYVHDADSLDQLLTSGEYNCMSVSLVYLALCKETNIAAHAVATRGHVRIHLPQFPDHDLETTCAEWSQALVARPASFASATSWRDLTTTEFLAKIYFNRATRAIQQQQWSRAIAFANTACQLDPRDQASDQNRLAAYNEWALEACQAKDYQLARKLLSEALLWSPHDATLQANLDYVTSTAE